MPEEREKLNNTLNQQMKDITNNHQTGNIRKTVESGGRHMREPLLLEEWYIGTGLL